MIPVEEATRIVQSNLLKTSIVEVDFSDAVGRILAEPVTVDRDLPPFNRATMDGIAIYFDSLSSQHSFPIQSTQAAGEPQQTLSAENHCIEIMTGASLPVGADTVIPYEQIRIKEKIATVLQDAKFEKGQNIHRQGVDAKRGDVIIKTGVKISPAEVAVLASVGKSKVLVYEWPKIAIISTGNELVEVTEKPFNHQIRKSNSYALQAAIRLVCSWEGTELNHQWAQRYHFIGRSVKRKIWFCATGIGSPWHSKTFSPGGTAAREAILVWIPR